MKNALEKEKEKKRREKSKLASRQKGRAFPKEDSLSPASLSIGNQNTTEDDGNKNLTLCSRKQQPIHSVLEKKSITR